MQNFRELKVWEKAHELTLAVYRITESFPAREQFGLTSQIRRSCASVPTNIAEGCGRSSRAEFAHFLHVAAGSASELEYQLLLVRDLGLVSPVDHEQLDDRVTELKRMLSSLIRTLQTAKN